MKLVLLILLVVACKNDAITYAHIIDPAAACSAIQTGDASSLSDTASCTSHGRVWFCFALRGMTACLDGDRVVHVRPDPAEAP